MIAREQSVHFDRFCGVTRKCEDVAKNLQYRPTCGEMRTRVSSYSTQGFNDFAEFTKALFTLVELLRFRL